MKTHSREALAQAYRNAADALESGAFEGKTCCGIPLNEYGQCVNRPGHPTIGHPNLIGYPEFYDQDGNLIE